jgi:hypothetical protein
VWTRGHRIKGRDLKDALHQLWGEPMTEIVTMPRDGYIEDFLNAFARNIEMAADMSERLRGEVEGGPRPGQVEEWSWDIASGEGRIHLQLLRERDTWDVLVYRSTQVREVVHTALVRTTEQLGLEAPRIASTSREPEGDRPSQGSITTDPDSYKNIELDT